jgi:hypothetical protein
MHVDKNLVIVPINVVDPSNHSVANLENSPRSRFPRRTIPAESSLSNLHRAQRRTARLDARYLALTEIRKSTKGRKALFILLFLMAPMTRAAIGHGNSNSLSWKATF